MISFGFILHGKLCFYNRVVQTRCWKTAMPLSFRRSVAESDALSSIFGRKNHAWNAAFMCLYEQKPVFKYMFLFAPNARIEQDTGIYHGFLLFANATATSKADQPETQVFAGFSTKIWYVYGNFGHETATVNHQGPSDGYNPQICRKCPP